MGYFNGYIRKNADLSKLQRCEAKKRLHRLIRGLAHQREEVGVTVLEAGAVGGGVGVPVAVAVGRVAHGDEGLLGSAVGGADSAAGRVFDNSILL